MQDNHATKIHDEVAASIDATLIREARTNEVAIATVRVGLLMALGAVEVLDVVSGQDVNWMMRAPTAVMLIWAIVFWMILKKGWFHPSIPLIAPILDAGFVFAREQGTYAAVPLSHLQSEMELATPAAAACVLILTGAYRLRRASLIETTILGIGLYAWFAVQSGVSAGQLLTQGALIAGVGGMAYGLTTQVRRAVRSEVARQTITRFLPESVVDELHADPVALLTKPRAVEATVLITDIRGFTAWAQDKEPMEVLAFLNVIQGALAETVREHEGTVDKFMGDGMLAVFGAPKHLKNHGEQAVKAALRMQKLVSKINQETTGDVRVGIGVHSGNLVVGCLGSGVRMEFTVLGDTVNIASRLEAKTKTEGVDILISAATIASLPQTTGLRELGNVDIRGRKDPMLVWTTTS